jgi:hypothetical protein
MYDEILTSETSETLEATMHDEILTSEASDTLEATMTSMMKTSKRGKVTIEWTQQRNEFSLKQK